MQNNPTSKFDWLGNYFSWANPTVEDTYHKMREENNKRMGRYLSELISTMKSGEEGKGIDKRINQLAFLINEHADLNSQWDEMEGSNVEFHISSEDPGKGLLGLTTFDLGKSPKENRVNIKLGKHDKDLMNMAHEFRHGYGIMAGEILGIGGRADPLYDLTDELVAYNTGFLFGDGYAVDHVANGFFDKKWFMQNPEGYSSIIGKDESLTLNTSAAVYFKYNPNERLSVILGNAKNANLTVKDAMDIINNHNQGLNRKPVYYYGSLLNNR
ncbi:hypothetical protein J7I42_21040 [Niastella sp. MAH-29]|uniref:Uncharacterized protein n=2 Tax=Chitinophagaceae TaxID=563835 RepID=A0ABS3YY38_9BACT|nr:hypothetical protein [Niastella soli]